MEVQVANQHNIENISMMLVSKMLITVDEKWLKIGIFKYKLLKMNLVLNKHKLSVLPCVMTDRQGRTYISWQGTRDDKIEDSSA